MAAPVRFTISPDTLRADAQGQWRASVQLDNSGELGIYPDSLLLEQLSLDPDSSDAPRRAIRSLAGLVRVMTPAGAGGSTGIDWNAPAEFTRGQLQFTIYAHDANKQPIVLSAGAVVEGSELAERTPSRIVGTPGTEVIVLPPNDVLEPGPAVVVVLPPGVAARSQVRWAKGLQSRGYAVMLTSAPGWGLSRGRSDRSGPADVAAADAGIRTALAEPGVDPKRVAVWGHGRGATAALLAAIAHPELAGIVAVDAYLDPATEYASLKGAEQEEFIRVVGRKAAQWNPRSPLAQATRIAAPVLLVLTQDAASHDAAPAEEFMARRSDAKLFIEARLDGKEAHPIRRRDAERLALDFLARRTHSAGK